MPGNHDVKLIRWLHGRNVKLTHGLAESAAQLEQESTLFRGRMREFLDGLVSHLWLDGGQLVVAHAGIKEEMIGRSSGAVREFCLYGETTGETDEFGLPVRHNWAAEYRGKTTVVYGHTPVVNAEWLNNTICIDTGCVFGGKLTALRWPEKELVEVPAGKVYAEPVRPLAGAGRGGLSLQHAHDDLLDLSLVLGKRIVEIGWRAPCHDRRGQRRGGAGGDEPVRHPSQVADLPAAHHVAAGHQQPRRPAGAPGRGVGLLPRRGHRRGRGRGEAHGLAGAPGRLPRRGCRA